MYLLYDTGSCGVTNMAMTSGTDQGVESLCLISLINTYVMQPGSGEDPKLQNTLKNASYQGGWAAN